MLFMMLVIIYIIKQRFRCESIVVVMLICEEVVFVPNLGRKPQKGVWGAVKTPYGYLSTTCLAEYCQM